MRNANNLGPLGLTCRFTGNSICTILMLMIAVQLGHSDAVIAQSSTVGVPARPLLKKSYGYTIQSSVTAAQFRTESILAKDVTTFRIPTEEILDAEEVFRRLPVTVFLDQNLEGYFDSESEIELKDGSSLRRSLSHALTRHDVSFMVNSDGSISIISIDDEYEPEYMRTHVYDVTPIANSSSKANALASVLLQTIHSDSWEQNGSGNGTLAIYQQNGRILASISQSYRIQLAIRSHLNSMLSLGGVATQFEEPESTFKSDVNRSPKSSVVEIPKNRTNMALRSRRGMARPGSGTSGGFGGGKGGVF